MPLRTAPLWVALLAAAATAAGSLLGCGAPAAPLPPTLNLPQPVHDLAVSRVGSLVRARFTVPARTTDKLPVRGSMTAVLCRSLESGPCQTAVSEAIPPGAAAMVVDDPLPPPLAAGAPRLLTYRVTVLNRAGNSAGDSGDAFTASGAAPPPVSGLSCTPRRQGIVLSWQGTGEPGALRFERRTLAGPPSRPAGAGAGRAAPKAEEQEFRVPEPASAGPVSAIDITAAAGATYRYTAQRIRDVQVGGRRVPLASPPGPPVETDYRDIYPPPVPAGLVSAPDSAAHAIDLNWTPDVDAGLAGYFVYRREAGSPQAPIRISPAAPVRDSSWSDATARPGERYAYSVSAVDVSGNESARSAEVEDGWSVHPGTPPGP